MCNNRSWTDRQRFDRLARYAKKVLEHKSFEEIAKEEGITKEQLEKDLRSIKDINPPLYKQIFEEY